MYLVHDNQYNIYKKIGVKDLPWYIRIRTIIGCIIIRQTVFCSMLSFYSNGSQLLTLFTFHLFFPNIGGMPIDTSQCQCSFPVRILPSRVLARDQSPSLEDWQKLATTGEIVWFYNGRDRKKTGKIVRNGHFGRAVSESWLNPCYHLMPMCACMQTGVHM